MKRRVLPPLAAGAGLTVTAFLISYWYQQNSSQTEQLVWSYKRNTGPEPWPAHDTKDPITEAEPVSDYAVFVARRCQIPRWSVDSNIGTTDVDDEARLVVSTSVLSDQKFNCLASFVKPPYVTLTRKRT